MFYYGKIYSNKLITFEKISSLYGLNQDEYNINFILTWENYIDNSLFNWNVDNFLYINNNAIKKLNIKNKELLKKKLENNFIYIFNKNLSNSI